MGPTVSDLAYLNLGPQVLCSICLDHFFSLVRDPRCSTVLSSQLRKEIFRERLHCFFRRNLNPTYFRFNCQTKYHLLAAIIYLATFCFCCQTSDACRWHTVLGDTMTVFEWKKWFGTLPSDHHVMMKSLILALWCIHTDIKTVINTGIIYCGDVVLWIFNDFQWKGTDVLKNRNLSIK